MYQRLRSAVDEAVALNSFWDSARAAAPRREAGACTLATITLCAKAGTQVLHDSGQDGTQHCVRLFDCCIRELLIVHSVRLPAKALSAAWSQSLRPSIQDYADSQYYSQTAWRCRCASPLCCERRAWRAASREQMLAHACALPLCTRRR